VENWALRRSPEDRKRKQDRGKLGVEEEPGRSEKKAR
jgi:hypothetical protein